LNRVADRGGLEPETHSFPNWACQAFGLIALQVVAFLLPDSDHSDRRLVPLGKRLNGAGEMT